LSDVKDASDKPKISREKFLRILAAGSVTFALGALGIGNFLKSIRGVSSSEPSRVTGNISSSVGGKKAIVPASSVELPAAAVKKLDDEYFILVRELSSRLKFPIKSVDELDIQMGNVTLDGRTVRMKSILPQLNISPEDCRKIYFPIIDTADFHLKAGRFLETKGFRQYFLSYSPTAVK
jgi:hypothetical protein